MSRAIVTVGIHPTRGFGKYLDRFRRTFDRFGEADEVLIWDQHWPQGSPPHDFCHYAFKVHAVRCALERGHQQILWLDSSCHAIRPVASLWARLEREGHILIRDNEPLGKWSSDYSLAFFKLSRDQAMEIPLMCGTCWGVDIGRDKSRAFVDHLQSLAVPQHFNGTHVSRLAEVAAHPRPGTEGAQMSHDPRCWGHRSDEVYMSLISRELGLESHVGVEFVGGMAVTDQACIRSGYDL